MSYLALAKQVEARLRAGAPVPMSQARETGALPPHAEPDQAPSLPLRPGAPAFTETVVQLLSLPLDRFAEAGHCLEVRVPWWTEPLWFVPTEADAEALVTEGISRGRLWTAGELRDLLTVPGLTTDQARTVALAKLTLGGEVAEVRRPPAAGLAAGRTTGRRAVNQWGG